MKNLPLFLLFFFLLVSCSTIRETRTLTRCEFRYDRISDLQMAGIVLDDIHSYKDLNMLQMASLSNALLSGDLPLQMTLILQARNPNSLPAAMNELEYILYLDDVEMTRDKIDRKIVIPPGETVSIPVSTKLNFLEVFKLSSLQSITNLVLSLSERPGYSSRLTVKVRPSILIGKRPVYYPGYIKISQELGAQAGD